MFEPRGRIFLAGVDLMCLRNSKKAQVTGVRGIVGGDGVRKPIEGSEEGKTCRQGRVSCI